MFTPNCLMHWEKMSRRENPTRSIAINNFLKLFKRLEVKKLEAKSKARRSIAPSFLLNSVHENYNRLHNKELNTNPVD